MKALVWHDEELGRQFDVVDIPDDLKAEAEQYHPDLIDNVSQYDDNILEKFIGEEEITVADLKAAIRKATIEDGLVPVLNGSAFKNKGVQPLLDAVVYYLPSPERLPPVEGLSTRGNETLFRKPSPNEPFAALAFKIVADPHGKLTYFRVYSGTLEKGSQVMNARTESKERVGRLLLMHANNREDLDVVQAGDIVAGIGLKDTRTGDTLCDPAHPIVLEQLEFPEPVIHVAVEPKTKNDQDKLGKALYSLSEEDPTFQVRTDEETGQTIISGMGELHLEVLVDRMLREFGVDATVGKPQVAYRETITGTVEKHVYRHVKQTGGSGQFAHVVIDLEPTGPGGGYEFVDKISGGKIPKEYIPSVDQGIQASLVSGVLAGYPDGRHPGVAGRRLLPRRRLLGDGVQGGRVDGLQGGRPQGQARHPRADHGRRGRHARGLHGRRHRRPLLPSRQGRRHGAAWQQPGRSELRCPCRRCSVTLPTSDRAPRAVPTTRCSSSRTSRPPSRSRKRSSPASAASSSFPPPTHAPPDSAPQKGSRTSHGQGKVRSEQAAPEHRDDGSHRPWQDDVDGGDHQGAARCRSGVGVHAVRHDRQGA